MSGIVNVNTDYLNDVLNRAKVSRKQASGELGRSEWYLNLNNLCQKPQAARWIPLATAKLFCRIYNADLEELVPETKKETPIYRADAENIEIIAEVLCKIRDTQRRMEEKIDAIAAKLGVTL